MFFYLFWRVAGSKNDQNNKASLYKVADVKIIILKRFVNILCSWIWKYYASRYAVEKEDILGMKVPVMTRITFNLQYHLPLYIYSIKTDHIQMHNTKKLTVWGLALHTFKLSPLISE